MAPYQLGKQGQYTGNVLGLLLFNIFINDMGEDFIRRETEDSKSSRKAS